MLDKIMYRLGYITNDVRHRYKRTFWGAPYHRGRVDAALDEGARQALERLEFASRAPSPREVVQWLEDHAEDSPESHPSREGQDSPAEYHLTEDQFETASRLVRD